MRDNAVSTAVYIQAGDNFKVEALTLGTADFYYMLGEDWNHPERQFTRKIEYHRSSGSMLFREWMTTGYINYNYYTFALAAGTTNSSYPIVSAASFPALPK
jgi:hypothetical protein